MWVNLTNKKQLYIQEGNGKMGNIYSISVSTQKCNFCEKMSKIDSICKKCYARKTEKLYSRLEKCLSKNYDLLTTQELNNQDLKIIQAIMYTQKALRFNAFGEIDNMTQLKNYMNIAKSCKGQKIALYTKNIKLLYEYIKDNKMPKNVNVVLSSYQIGKPLNRYNLNEQLQDSTIFTVFKEPGEKRNCFGSASGNVKCSNCMKCYMKKAYDIVEALH